MKTLTNYRQRKNRVRAKISGTSERPRLSVYVSNRHVIAQIIDDVGGQTLVHVTTVGEAAGKTLTEKATWAGKQIAERAKAKKIKLAVFDRGGRRYHGRLRALAEAVRAEGIEF